MVANSDNVTTQTTPPVATVPSPGDKASTVEIPAQTSILEICSDKVSYSPTEITAKFQYETTKVLKTQNKIEVHPVTCEFQFKTDRKVPRVGMMLVGWGGNNGTTVTAGIIANRENITWHTNQGVKHPDYLGSITQVSTMRIGSGPGGEQVYVPLKDVLPMVNPNDLIIGGWDISKVNLAEGMHRAQVLPYELQSKLTPYMKEFVPLPSIYDPDFIASNQESRADNVITGTKSEQMNQIRRDIRNFKASNSLEKVIVLWTANTERFCEVSDEIHGSQEALFRSIENNASEVSPSTLFACASILEGCPYINGSPQNTFVKGVIELAENKKVFIGCDDFKSGQTKMKSVLVDFLVSAGIKPVSVVSYNHLGNNDGKNLSEQKQFRSKEISKSNVVDDMVESNHIMYKEGEKPDHCVVIKYVPYVSDSKRAMDEYTSEIFMGGHNTIVMHNTCEDSLLASPLIIDLVILTELFTRVTYKCDPMQDFEHFHPVLTVLSYLLKAPLVAEGTPVINALFRQRACIENLFRACVGLPPDNNLLMEYKTGFSLMEQEKKNF